MSEPTTLKKNEKKYHHGDLRGALLEAIRQLIEREGADSFSIAEACRIAGVSTAAPYKHFRDRGEMLRGVALLAMDRLRADMQDAVNAHAPRTPERVVALGQAYVDFARREPGVFRLMFGLSGDHAEDAELTEAGEKANLMVEGVVSDHLDLPVGSDEVRLRAYALWCFVHGHSFLVLDGKRSDAEAALPEHALLDLVGRAILPV